MSDPDVGFEEIKNIYTEFGDFCKKRGEASEADTRVKVIDRILKEVLGWPESYISREDNVVNGFIDYRIEYLANKRIIIEAKKEGVYFSLPLSINKKKYLIGGSISSNENVRKAIDQVQHYCGESGSRYAVVTNGYSWILFRAIRDDIPWRKGHAIVFPSAGYILKNFAEFWNTLSYEAVKNGSFEELFFQGTTEQRTLTRPISHIRNADAPLNRNRFHFQLHAFVESVFRDIGSRSQIELMEKCYVYDTTLRIVDKDIKIAIEDSIPRFVKHEGGVDIVQTETEAGEFDAEFQGAVKSGEGRLILLLGGVGSGKSTFLRRFINKTRRSFLESNAFWYYINFLSAPPNKEHASSYIHDSILTQIRERYADVGLETRDSIKLAYADQIKQLHAAVFDAEKLADSDYEKRLSRYIERWIQNKMDYVPRITRLAKHFGKANIVVIDNVDQLSPEYQSEIFLIAQWAAKNMNAVVIVSLREESYYAASIRRAFTAYNNRKFHIASPHFKKLIELRLKYCFETLKLPDEQIVLRLGRRISFNKKEVETFLKIIYSSIFVKNKNIFRFIDALAYGNMREALEMFTMFLYSGATDADKILRIYNKGGRYSVPFHEFAKAIILGDRLYYKEAESKILNMFDCGNDKNSSHFTSFRVLMMLLQHIGESSPEGRGFMKIDDLFSPVIDIFDNEQDLIKTCDKLLRKQLVQVDTRATDKIDGSYHIRATSAGWYYYKYLVKAFSYLDLVYQDTPIADEVICKKLFVYTREHEEVAKSTDNVNEKMKIRFKRVDEFLNYLNKEEEMEVSRYSLHLMKGVLSKKYIPEIILQYQAEKGVIESKLTAHQLPLYTDSFDIEEKGKDMPITDS